jgi:hypothetical protein
MIFMFNEVSNANVRFGEAELSRRDLRRMTVWGRQLRPTYRLSCRFLIASETRTEPEFSGQLNDATTA